MKKPIFTKRRILITLCGILAVALAVSALVLRDPLRTLAGIEKVDEHPLYTMRYYGGYGFLPQTQDELMRYYRLFGGEAEEKDHAALEEVIRRINPEYLGDIRPLLQLACAVPEPELGCSLFAAFGDGHKPVYGRNFDWHFSPAVIIYTDPPHGYASVSMVDVAYLGIGDDVLDRDLTWRERLRLLACPIMPFDGVNDQGVAAAIAAVHESPTPYDPKKRTVTSVVALRLMLDNASTTDEAVEVLRELNVAFEPGPQIHYLIADKTGNAAVVEFLDGKMSVLPNTENWHAATNFYLTGADKSKKAECWRYTRLEQALQDAKGDLKCEEAVKLLQEVSQESTQWSVAYDLDNALTHVVMGRRYTHVHRLSFTN